MREKHRAAKTLIWLTASLIVLPLMVLLVWCFANRWAYPSLLPENFSLRGLEQVLFGYHDMGRIVGSSILISVVAAVLCVTASALAARAVVFYDFKGKRILEFLTMIPVIIPATVFGMGIHMMFIKGGLNHTITGVILTHIVVSLPYGVKIMTDITKLYGRNLEEQAMVLGANSWQSFWLVGFPKLTPGIASALSMTFIISFSQYFLTLLIGGGRVKTFSVVMVPFIQSGDKTIAANYSGLFILITFIVFLIFDKIGKKARCIA